MARIRTIKPEFFTSESILELEPLARLFFISLWCEADREGRLSWKPKTLKYRYLPADDIDVNVLAKQIIDQGLIEIYQVGESVYCEITGFHKHQVINNRERESDIPDPENANSIQKPRNSTETGLSVDASLTRESGEKAEGREGKEGRERKGKEGKGNNATTRFTKPTLEEVQNYFIDQNVPDWLMESGKFFDYYESIDWTIGKHCKPMKSWKGAANNWLRNKIEFDKQKQPGQQSFIDRHTSTDWADMGDKEQ